MLTCYDRTNRTCFLPFWLVVVIFWVTVADCWAMDSILQHGDETGLFQGVANSVLTLLGVPLPVPSSWKMPLALSALATVLLVVVGYFKSRHFRRLHRIIRQGNHTVLWAGSNPTAQMIIHNHLASRQPLLILVKDSSLSWVQEAVAKGAGVMVGDPMQKKTLVRSRILTAKAFMSLSMDEETVEEKVFGGTPKYEEIDIDAALSVGRFVFAKRRPDSPPLLVTLNLTDELLKNQLDASPECYSWRTKVQFRLFSMASLAARNLFLNHSCDRFRYLAHPYLRHIVIIGFGSAGQEIFRQFTRLSHFQDGTPPKVTVLDRLASYIKGWYWDRDRCPELSQWVSPDFIELDTRHEALLSHRLMQMAASDAPPTAFYVCYGTSEEGLAVAGQVERILIQNACFVPPIYLYWIDHNLPITQLNLDTINMSGMMIPFGEPTHILDSDLILLEHLDALSRFIHESYLKKMLESGHKLGAWPSLHSWPELSEFFKEQNRSQADHHLIKLREMGYRPSSRSDATESWSPSREEIEAMAIAEHQRWCASRWVAGWRCGERNDAEKRHPDLIPYQALSEMVKEKDRDVIVTMPLLMRAFGKPVCKDLVVLVTGGNAKCEAADVTRMGTDVENFLRQLTIDQDHRPIRLISPIHDAVHRAICQAGVACGCHLYLLLPAPAWTVLATIQTANERTSLLSWLQQAEGLLVGDETDPFPQPFHTIDATIHLPPDGTRIVFKVSEK